MSAAALKQGLPGDGKLDSPCSHCSREHPKRDRQHNRPATPSRFRVATSHFQDFPGHHEGVNYHSPPLLVLSIS